MRRWGFVALLAVALVLLVGCARPTVIGKWSSSMPVRGAEFPATFEFGKDNALTIVVDYEENGVRSVNTFRGTWEVTTSEGTTVLTMRANTIESAGRSKTMAVHPISGPITFDKDAFRMGDGSSALVFTRVGK